MGSTPGRGTRDLTEKKGVLDGEMLLFAEIQKDKTAMPPINPAKVRNCLVTLTFVDQQ
jgi:hypothetical protein